jgi:hypothetical protein
LAFLLQNKSTLHSTTILLSFPSECYIKIQCVDRLLKIQNSLVIPEGAKSACGGESRKKKSVPDICCSRGGSAVRADYSMAGETNTPPLTRANGYLDYL